MIPKSSTLTRRVNSRTVFL